MATDLIMLAAVSPEAQAPMGIVQIDPGTIVFTLINTVIICAAYYFLLHKKVVEILERRTELINSEIEEAEASKTKAKELEREYGERVKNSKTEADRIIAKAQKLGEDEGRRIVDEARGEAVRAKETAHAEIARETAKAGEELKNQFAGLVLSAAAAVTEKQMNRQDNEQIIDSFLQKI